MQVNTMGLEMNCTSPLWDHDLQYTTAVQTSSRALHVQSPPFAAFHLPMKQFTSDPVEPSGPSLLAYRRTAILSSFDPPS